MNLKTIKIMEIEAQTGKLELLLESFYPHSAPAEDLVQWPFNQQLIPWWTSKKFVPRAD